MSVFDVGQSIRERIPFAAEGEPDNYGLFHYDADPTKGRWLEGGHTLAYYHLKNGDVLQFREKTRTLRIKTLDGNIETQQVDDSLTVAEIISTMCDFIGITNPKEFRLYVDQDTSEKPPSHLPSQIMQECTPYKLDVHKTFREQGIDETQVLILRNRLHDIKRKYTQSHDSIIKGNHLCTKELAVMFAAYQCQIQFGNYDETELTGLINLAEFLPLDYQSVREIEREIFKEYQKLQDMEAINAKAHYNTLYRSLKTYGVTFHVKEKRHRQNQRYPRLLGITRDTVTRMEENGKVVLKTWPITTITRWAVLPNSFIFEFGVESYYYLYTNEGEKISQLLPVPETEVTDFELVPATIQTDTISTEAVVNIKNVVQELETLAMFATAEALMSEGSVGTITEHCHNIVETAQSFGEVIEHLLSSVDATHKQLNDASYLAVKTIRTTFEHVKLGAMSISSDYMKTQLQLLYSVRDVANSLADLVHSLYAAFDKSISDPNMKHLKKSAISMIDQVSILVKTVMNVLDNYKNDYRDMPDNQENICLKAFRDGKQSRAVHMLRMLDDPSKVKSQFNTTLLHLAARHGWRGVAELLITKYHSDPHCVNNAGWSALHFAIQSGHLKVVRYLIEKQCSPVCQSSKWSPLDIAHFCNHHDIVQYLSNVIIDSALEAAMKNDFDSFETRCSVVTMHGHPGAGKNSLKQLILGHDPLNVIESSPQAISTSRLVADNSSLIEVDHGDVIKMLAQAVMSHNITSQDAHQIVPYESSENTYGNSSATLRAIKSCLSKVSTSKKLSVTTCNSIYLIDSDYFEMLPFYSKRASLHIVLIPLNRGLDDKPKVRVCTDGTVECLNHLALSNRELIEKLCQAAEAVAQETSGRFVPWVMVVGTCKDLLGNSKRLLLINKELLKISTAYKGVLIQKSFKEIVFAIDAMTPELDVRQEYSRELQSHILRAVGRNSFSMPFRLCVFDLDLELHSGVIQKEECYKTGEVLGMKQEDVDRALQDFNKCVLRFSYPNALPLLVFTKIDPLLRRLSSLIDVTFNPPESDPTGKCNSDRLRMKGLFSKSFFQSVVSNVDDGENLKYGDFLTLLETLNVAIRAENDYFLPCALPLKPPSDRSPLPLSCVPLVYAWGTQIVPLGFFDALVVALLQYPHFVLEEGIGLHRDVIQLTTSNHYVPGILKLVNRYKWIELIYTDSPIYCFDLREIIDVVVKKVLDSTGLPPPDIGFLCYLCDTPDHYCVLSSDKRVVTCSADKSKSGPITSRMLCWLKQQDSDENYSASVILIHGAIGVGKSSVQRILEGLPPHPKCEQKSTDIIESRVFRKHQSHQSGVTNIPKRVQENVSDSNHFDIHIVNGGGQPQFDDTLPLLFHNASSHIVVIPLDEELKDRPKAQYLVSDEDIYNHSKRHRLSNLEMITRTCELAEAAKIANPNRPPPWVSVVGTKLDRLSATESLKEKNRRLRRVVECFPHILRPKSNQEVIFALNAMVPKGEERVKYTNILQKLVVHAPEMLATIIPSRWIRFKNRLDHYSTDYIVTKPACLEVGKQCGMNEHDIENALNHFTSLPLYMHFPESLPNLIFTKFHPVVGRLSLLLTGFDPMNKYRMHFRATGVLTKALLHTLLDVEFNQYKFTIDDFIVLLKYLRIAVNIDDDSHFVPCVLPTDDPHLDDTLDSITFTWGKRILPQGFFPALVVELLRSPHFDHCPQEKQLRHAVYLQSRKGMVRLVEHISFFELYFFGEKKDRPVVVKAVKESADILTDLNTFKGISEVKYGFRCPGIHFRSEELIHPCVIVQPDLLAQPEEAQCVLDETYRIPLSPSQKSWFKSLADDDATQASVSDYLQESDLFEIIKATESSYNDWYLLGIVLGIDDSRLDKIEREYPGMQERQIKLFQTWISSGNATWSRLVDALRSPLVHRNELAQEINEKHPSSLTPDVKNDNRDTCTSSVQTDSAVDKTFRDLLNKPPELMDVFDLVRHSSSSWHEIGRELHIPDNERNILRRDPSINNDEKLERVLATWIYNEPTDVKWSVILDVLERLERKDLAKMVMKFLERPETYKKYISKKDYTPFTF